MKISSNKKANRTAKILALALGLLSATVVIFGQTRTFNPGDGTRGQNKAADLPGANLTFSKADGPAVSTKGRALDHIGFDVNNLEAFSKKLEAAGIKLERPITKNANGVGIAFISDPWGTYIELNERPNAVYIQTTSR